MDARRIIATIRDGGQPQPADIAAFAQGIASGAVTDAQAGAFAMVIEGTVEPLAREITAQVSAATIGIGASPACDGQILVSDDMLGLFNEFKPRFVKHFTELATIIDQAVADYADEVKARTFPGPEHTFQIRAKK